MYAIAISLLLTTQVLSIAGEEKKKSGLAAIDLNEPVSTFDANTIKLTVPSDEGAFWDEYKLQANKMLTLLAGKQKFDEKFPGKEFPFEKAIENATRALELERVLTSYAWQLSICGLQSKNNEIKPPFTVKTHEEAYDLFLKLLEPTDNRLTLRQVGLGNSVIWQQVQDIENDINKKLRKE